MTEVENLSVNETIFRLSKLVAEGSEHRYLDKKEIDTIKNAIDYLTLCFPKERI